MSIEFNAEEKADLISRLQGYCDTELDRELGSFEAQFLMDFIMTLISEIMSCLKKIFQKLKKE